MDNILDKDEITFDNEKAYYTYWIINHQSRMVNFTDGRSESFKDYTIRFIASYLHQTRKGKFMAWYNYIKPNIHIIYKELKGVIDLSILSAGDINYIVEKLSLFIDIFAPEESYKERAKKF